MMNPAFNGNMFNMNMNVNMNMNMNMNMTDEYKITNKPFYFPQMSPFNPLYQAYLNNPQCISINDFHKLNELGAGKHGSVGRYRNIYNNQIYAIKIMEQRVFKNKTGKEKDTDYNREILILSNAYIKIILSNPYDIINFKTNINGIFIIKKTFSGKFYKIYIISFHIY